jgi:glycerol-3-phosphate acyltransferase PlsY
VQGLLLAIVLPIVVFAAAFLLGSVPFGYVIGRLFYRTDIRSHGSGNIGAMNALRTLGKAGAAAVLLLDALKGFVPAFYVVTQFRGVLDVNFTATAHLSFSLPHTLGAVAAAGAVLGHCFSPWLRWRGGKGVATSFGALFGLCWPAGLAAVAVWVAGAAATRYSSVGSMLGSVAAPFAIWFFTRSPAETIYAAFAAALIVVTHRDNLARLRSGTESPIRLRRG